MELVPIEKKAIGISQNRVLYAARNQRLWVVERGDPERTIDPDDVAATETLVTVYADSVGATPVAQPLYSDVSGSFRYWVSAGALDLYLPDDPVHAIQPWQAISAPLAGAMSFEGSIDCSANPNYPAANAGDTYRISVAGKIGGASGPKVEIGDLLICLDDATAAGTHAAIGSHWTIEQANIDGAIVGPASVTADHIAQFDGTTGKVLKDGGALGTAAHAATGDFDAAGAAAAAQAASQPLDSDLTAIAALSTTSYGRGLLALADAAAGRTALGLGTAATHATGDYDAAGAAASALTTAEAYTDTAAALLLPKSVRSYITTEETTTSNSYTTMTTPDQVVVSVTANGQIVLVHLSALIKHTGASGDGAAALFIDGNQLKAKVANGPPAVQERTFTSAVTFYTWLQTTGLGVVIGTGGLTPSADASEVTTGMTAMPGGGSAQGVAIEGLPIGSHTITFQVKAGTSGTVSMKNRRMTALVI